MPPHFLRAAWSLSGLSLVFHLQGVSSPGYPKVIKTLNPANSSVSPGLQLPRSMGSPGSHEYLSLPYCRPRKVGPDWKPQIAGGWAYRLMYSTMKASQPWEE